MTEPESGKWTPEVERRAASLIQSRSGLNYYKNKRQSVGCQSKRKKKLTGTRTEELLPLSCFFLFPFFFLFFSFPVKEEVKN